MATSVTRDERHETEPGDLPGHPPTNHAEWLWALSSFVLLLAILAVVVDDHPLRTLLSGN